MGRGLISRYRIASFAGVRHSRWSVLVVALLLAELAAAQGTFHPSPSIQQSAPELKVNWLYGAYVPEGAPLQPLSADQRWKLYLRQSFTTPGIYVKTLLFSVGDQIDNSPPAWGSGFDGYAQRAGSRQAQFVLQNSFVALGNGLLGYEPRYDRCRCSGFWDRTAHALRRNLVTYDRTEEALRPQFALYGGAFAAGVVSGAWKPRGRDLVAEGYRSAFTQVAFGFVANLVGEFAPEIKRILGRNQTVSDQSDLKAKK